MLFCNSLAFSMIQKMLAIWSLVPLPFLNAAWTSGSSRFTYCWSLAWRILSFTLLAWEISAIVQWFERPLALPFFGLGMKTDLFQSCGHCWVFQICWQMSAAIKQHHLLGFEIAQLEFCHLHSLCLQWCFLSPYVDFALQDVWLYVSDHTTLVICVMKVFFV